MNLLLHCKHTGVVYCWLNINDVVVCLLFQSIRVTHESSAQEGQTEVCLRLCKTNNTTANLHSIELN